MPVIFCRNNAKIRERKKKCQVRRSRKWLFIKWNHKRMLKKIKNILRLKTFLENNKANRLFFVLQEHIFHPIHLLGIQEHSKRPASWSKTFFANLPFREYTLYNVLLRKARKLLETRENVKILTHPVYHTNLD